MTSELLSKKVLVATALGSGFALALAGCSSSGSSTPSASPTSAAPTSAAPAPAPASAVPGPPAGSTETQAPKPVASGATYTQYKTAQAPTAVTGYYNSSLKTAGYTITNSGSGGGGGQGRGDGGQRGLAGVGGQQVGRQQQLGLERLDLQAVRAAGQGGRAGTGSAPVGTPAPEGGPALLDPVQPQPACPLHQTQQQGAGGCRPRRSHHTRCTTHHHRISFTSFYKRFYI